jgi:hypothetical protein
MLKELSLQASRALVKERLQEANTESGYRATDAVEDENPKNQLLGPTMVGESDFSQEY